MKLDLTTLNTRLEKAIALAIYAHDGQLQRNGQPYILHPLHVMSRFEDDFRKIVAVLHDSVEDSNGKITIAMIDGIFGSPVASAIKLLTHDPAVPYDTYIKDISTSQVAIAVKIEDLVHNMDIRRLGKVHKKLDTYIKSWVFLKEIQRQNHWV